MIELLGIEVILSEISYYLSEVDLTIVEEDMHTLIQQECLIDYYYKLGNSHKEGNFLIPVLKSMVFEQ